MCCAPVEPARCALAEISRDKGSGQNHVKMHAKAQSLVWSWDTARARRVFHTALRGRLAEHHVRLEEKQRGNSHAQGLGRLEVDHQLELRGLLHREVL